MHILGISAYYHDSAAALLRDGEIVAAVQEERFTRKKHDAGFPAKSVAYCLAEAAISLSEVSYIAFYDKPFLKFERLLETYLSEAPRGLRSFMKAIPVWLKDKLFLKETLAREFAASFGIDKRSIYSKLMFGEHHQSHAASAFFPSPFDDAAILTVDGVGEWATTSLAHGVGNHLEFIQEIHFPHSLGLLYSAFTYYAGFKVNSGEYKLMGLAPYGVPRYVDKIKDHLIDIKDDGSFKLNLSFFDYVSGLRMTNQRFDALFGVPARKSESQLTQHHMDIASSIQVVTEEVMLKMARHARAISGSKNLCLAGGVALNCVSNGKLVKSGVFDEIWIQPAAGDAGGALGGAYAVYHEECKASRMVDRVRADAMRGAFLGPKSDVQETKKYLDSVNAKYEVMEETELLDVVSSELADNKVVGWHYDRMEFGPRSLGRRSILGNAQSPKMQSTMNLKIKYRESFRPFAPAVLREKVSEWFDLDQDSPYMLVVAPVKNSKRLSVTDEQERLFGIEKLNVPRSEIPAVTHIDYSARIQTVHRDTNPRFHRLLECFEKKTGCPVLVNTSFNVRGEPIVCTPEDSYRCFMRTEMDVLVIDNFILRKSDQPNFEDKGYWQSEFELD
jgi:carbamoyltransferase